MVGRREVDSASSIEPIASAKTDTVRSEHFPSAVGEIVYLVDVRAARRSGFDRVALEFDGQDLPSYRVGCLAPPIHRDGSGAVVAVRGEAFLEMRLTPASGVDLTGFEPPQHGGVVTEVVQNVDFEATLAWTIGLSRLAPFAVGGFRDPLRLVVDVLHQ